MRRFVSLFASLAAIVISIFSVSGCGYNRMQSYDEEIKSSWAEVVNQYQRRSDLIPNLVSTVKGYAAHEASVLEEVTKARASATQVKVDASTISDEESFQKFQQAQGSLNSALGRLLAVAENYPDLKANQNFRDLQAQLEGTENRITVARKRYIESVKEYNIVIRSFPSNLTAMLFGYKTKPSFTVENEKEISVAPKVDFGKP